MLKLKRIALLVAAILIIACIFSACASNTPSDNNALNGNNNTPSVSVGNNENNQNASLTGSYYYEIPDNFRELVREQILGYGIEDESEINELIEAEVVGQQNSRRRCRIEHIFGYMTRFMGGLTLRCHGINPHTAIFATKTWRTT